MQLGLCSKKEQEEQIRQLYESAFPASEKKPFAVILRLCREGNGEMLAIEDDAGVFLGLAICLLYRDLVLLDYFAVSPDCRGRGVGGQTLDLLRARYAGRRLLLEIEDPDEPGAPNRTERLRRRAFYLRNRMTPMPYDVMLFGVRMNILTDRVTVAYPEYHAIFDALFPPGIGRKITLAPPQDRKER